MTDLRTFVEAFLYDPEAGTVVSRKDRPNSPAGTLVGTTTASGHLRLCFKGKNYLVHRVAWLLTHGVWPDRTIDHIDCNPANNRLTNLRLATQGQNNANRRGKRSLPKGVYAHRKQYRARITCNGRMIHLGSYRSVEAAAAAYAAAATALFGEFARAA